MRKGLLSLFCVMLLFLMPGCTSPWGLSTIDDPEPYRLYKVNDSEGAATNDTNDTMMSIRWTQSSEELNWDLVSIMLEVGDTVYRCSIQTDEACLITQSGEHDNSWEPHEILTLLENDENIVGSSGATIVIRIVYSGELIQGTDSVYVV
jgi:hypothetical protein